MNCFIVCDGKDCPHNGVFLQYPKLAILTLCYRFTFENEMNYINFNSKPYDNCNLAVKKCPLVTSFILFSLKVIQKCQHCKITGKLE